MSDPELGYSPLTAGILSQSRYNFIFVVLLKSLGSPKDPAKFMAKFYYLFIHLTNIY